MCYSDRTSLPGSLPTHTALGDGEGMEGQRTGAVATVHVSLQLLGAMYEGSDKEQQQGTLMYLIDLSAWPSTLRSLWECIKWRFDVAILSTPVPNKTLGSLRNGP